MSPITTGVRPPLRSRTFTEQDARQAHAALTQYVQEGRTNEGVGIGDYKSAESARSAGVTLNRLIVDLGLTETKWATTVFPVTVPDPDNEGQEVERHRGVLLPKPAKVRAVASNGDAPATPEDAPTAPENAPRRGRKAANAS